jgi:pimeloyl-ACP methyl ester carboxylesterase
VTFDRFTTSHGAVWPIEEAGEGPTVLALHGVGGGAYFFRGLAERLGLQYRVMATDLPSGLHPDGRVDPASMEGWAEGLDQLLTARVTEPVVVVGHSLGTILALELWRRRPDLIRAMVFVGGLPRVRDLVRPRLRERLDAVAGAGMAGWGPRVAAGVFGARAFQTTPETIGMFERLLELHPPATYIRNMNALLAASAVDVAPSVTVPCLSISGIEDNYAPPEFVTTFVQSLGTGCEQVLLEGVGHMPFFEVPEAFAATVGEFLARLPLQSTGVG